MIDSTNDKVAVQLTGINMIDSTVTEAPVQLTGIVITAHVAKRSVSSEITHEPMVFKAVDPQTDTAVEVVHKARRFERAAQCPIATARRLFSEAMVRHPGVPCTLRFA